MAKECAFCPETAKLSAEHLWSQWMNDLFPGEKRFTRKNEKGEIVGAWKSDTLDWKAKVVCETCNNTWMSDIESTAKAAMSDLIRGESGMVISQSSADSIACFAFKTAVIFDHIQRNREPFFTRSVRHRFRASLAIPTTVRMFMAGFLPAGKGHVHTCYHEGDFSVGHIALYVCTYAVGHFVFQVVAQRQQGLTKFTLQPRIFESLGVEFWPWIPGGVVWPAHVLRTVDDFYSFSTRWRTLIVRS